MRDARGVMRGGAPRPVSSERASAGSNDLERVTRIELAASLEGGGRCAGRRAMSHLGPLVADPG